MSFLRHQRFECECGNTVELTYGSTGWNNRQSLRGLAQCPKCGLFLSCNIFGRNLEIFKDNPATISRKRATMELRFMKTSSRKAVLQQLFECVDTFGREFKRWFDVPIVTKEESESDDV